MEELLKAHLPNATVAKNPLDAAREWIVKVPLADWLDAAKKLYDLGFEYMSSITATDWPAEHRLEVVAHVYQMKPKTPVVSLRTDVGRDHPVVPSLTSVWPTANWHEREAFDMFGIRFDGHPDLRRILLPENWQGGHPLLKDFVDKRPPRPVMTRETYKP